MSMGLSCQNNLNTNSNNQEELTMNSLFKLSPEKNKKHIKKQVDQQ